MKGRAHRRWKEEVIVKRRLKSLCSRSGYWNFHDGNDDLIPNPRWMNYIGRIENFMYKTYVTDRRDSEYKTKYSPNKNKGYYRDAGKPKSKGTREYNKRIFRKFLENEGFKHFNTGQLQEMDNSEWISNGN